MPRVLSKDVCGQIQAYKKHFPHITGKKIYELLIKDGCLKKEETSLDSVYRYLKAAGLERGGMGPQECLAFEFGHANDCWQADTTFGPTVLEGKKHQQTYLIAFGPQGVDQQIKSYSISHFKTLLKTTNKKVPAFYLRPFSHFVWKARIHRCTLFSP